jgi:hypothetical protein
MIDLKELPAKLAYRAEAFDKLRVALRKHLEEIVPERDHRDAIIDLIADVKRTAMEEANALLLQRLRENGVEVFGSRNITEPTSWWEKKLVDGNVPYPTHTGILIVTGEIE